jgi:hypothetical protein
MLINTMFFMYHTVVRKESPMHNTVIHIFFLFSVLVASDCLVNKKLLLSVT